MGAKNSNNSSDSKNRLVEDAIRKAYLGSSSRTPYKFRINNKTYTWSNSYEKIAIIRNGLPYAAIEVISKWTNISIKHYLAALEIAQTTYNKRRKSNARMNRKDSEFIIELIELYYYGKSVFNNEIDKFQRWLRKPNISLGPATPDSMFDSMMGIKEVKMTLNRIEYGNLA